MLRHHGLTNSGLTRIADNLVVIFAFFLSYFGRQSLLFWDAQYNWNLPFGGERLDPLNRYYVVLFVGLSLFNLVWSILAAYDRNYIFNIIRVLRTATISSIFVFFGLAATLFTTKLDLSRTVIGLFCLFVAAGICVERYFLRNFLRYWNRKGRNSRNIVIAGTGDQGLRLRDEIEKRPELGLRLVGFAQLASSNNGKEATSADTLKVFSGAHEFEEALRRFAVDEVIFTDVRSNMDIVESIRIGKSII